MWMREGGSKGATFSYLKTWLPSYQTENLNSVSELLLLTGPLSTSVEIIVTAAHSPELLQQQCLGKHSAQRSWHCSC